MSQALVIDNGDMVRLAPGEAEIVDDVPTGRLGVDGGSLVRLDGDTIRHRHRMSFNGLIMVSVVLKDRALLAPPQVSLEGLLDGGEMAVQATAAMSKAVSDAIAAMQPDQARLDEAVAETARLAARRWFHKAHDKKPVTKVHVVRV